MKFNTRLSTVAPDLVELGAGLPAARRKTVACAAAQWACHKSNVTSLLGEEPLRLMLQPTYAATQQDRDMLSSKVDELDEKYFSTAGDQYDGSDEVDKASPWFEQARAIASLLYSFDAEDLLGFCDALYEAQAVTDDLEEFREVCRTGKVFRGDVLTGERGLDETPREG